ncbi:leucine-rich repeat-containing protein 74B-like isoform X2 [Pomacea canaliculata]|uniref:leucine-rich repeat-containing protein 74B-like isoform X2 n=1 Tax=Pomacea canaliculata TaxID=400727 RepID=UPI000D73701D|nr:leucine-rich repeat-containing protein 74B-like isoform X2 [Pomacea canaliculata]
MSQPLLSRPVQVNKTVFRRHRSAFARNKPVPKTISRTSSRRSRAGSSQSKKPGDKGQSSASDSENEDTRTRVSDFDNQADIMDEKAWETDLEPEVPEANSTYDHSGRKLYLEECARLGVIPVSYFLRHMTSRQLHMKHHGLRPSDMLAMASVLVSNTSILSLDLSDNWLGYHGGLAVCDMLKENCFISELNLSDNHLNRCAGELCRILRLNDYLRRVTLAGNGFDDKAAEYFAEFIGASSHVEYLSLSRNSLCERAGQLLGPAISENSCLKELDLSWNQLRRRGAVAVANGIKNNVFMKKINLAWNGFGLEGAVALGDAIKGNSVLEEIDITNNRITTEGAVVIGKGLSANETLKVLKMGINPMQSAGCWGICAAILKNPNSVLQALDFSDVSVNKDFEEILQKVKEQLPGLRVKHGGMDVPLKPKTPVHPMVKLMTYINKNNIRLVDFFNKFDKDGSMSVTPDEFYQGLQETGITLTEEEFQQLLKDLDRDGDGEINYSELVIGHTDFQDKEKKMQTVMTTVRPMTS